MRLPDLGGVFTQGRDAASEAWRRVRDRWTSLTPAEARDVVRRNNEAARREAAAAVPRTRPTPAPTAPSSGPRPPAPAPAPVAAIAGISVNAVYRARNARQPGLVTPEASPAPAPRAKARTFGDLARAAYGEYGYDGEPIASSTRGGAR